MSFGQEPRWRPVEITAPLPLIAVFLAVSEIALTVGVIGTDGGVQVLLAIFFVLFTAAVAGAFFVTLWWRPAVLYSPSQYGEQGPEQFVTAMHLMALDSRRLEVVLRDKLLASRVPAEQAAQISASVAEQAAKDVAEQAVEQLAGRAAPGELFMLVEARSLEPSHGGFGQGILFSHVEQLTVSHFLYRSLRRVAQSLGVQPEDYGATWLLYEEGTLLPLDDVGPKWAQRTSGKPADDRLIGETRLGSPAARRLLAMRTNEAPLLLADAGAEAARTS